MFLIRTAFLAVRSRACRCCFDGPLAGSLDRRIYSIDQREFRAGLSGRR